MIECSARPYYVVSIEVDQHVLHYKMESILDIVTTVTFFSIT